MTVPSTDSRPQTSRPQTSRPQTADRVRRAGPDSWSVRVPGLGTLQLSGAELIYVGGIVGLAAFGALDWPIGLVIAGGHLLAADRSSRTVRDLGEAMTEAG